MKPLDPSRIHTEYRDGVSMTSPIRGRKYTMTHSDDTAELFVTIGRNFAKDKIGPLRDEVVLEFVPWNKGQKLVGQVLISCPNVKGEPAMRNEIFLREMPTALAAIRYADRKLFERFPMLDTVPVNILFRSDDARFNKWYNFGSMKDYRIE